MNSKKTNKEIWQEELASRLPEFGCSNPLIEEELTIGNNDFTLTFNPDESDFNADWVTFSYCHDTVPVSQSMIDDQDWFHFLGESITVTNTSDSTPDSVLTFDTTNSIWDVNKVEQLYNLDKAEQDPQYQIDLDSIIEWLKDRNGI